MSRAVFDDSPQGSPGWHRARRGKITGTRIKTIMHGTPKGWNTLLDTLRHEIEHPDAEVADAPFVSADVEHGRKYEPVARANAELQLCEDFELVGFAQHPDFPFLGVSSDFMALDRTVNGEIKCPRDIRNFNAVRFSQRLPDEYYPQVQLQMFVHGVDRTIFVCHHPDAGDWRINTIVLNVYSDAEYQAAMLDRCQAFMAAVRGAAPMITDDTPGVPLIF